MAQSAPARTKINTKVTQPAAPGRSSRRLAGRPGPGRPPKGPRVSGEARDSVRQSARPVIELDFGILVYPPETDGEPWRAVFTENGQRKYRQGATEAKLAEKLEKVKERLQADAANMERPGADLIAHYLDPDRLPVDERWSRKHAHTQRRLCERFAEPVIGAVTCQDIKTWHTQQIVNAAPTAGEGDRVHGMLSALVAAGIEDGYLTNQRGAQVPEVPQDDLPPPHARRLPARRETRRPHRAGHRRAGSRHQPAGADLPFADGQALAILQLQPQRPQARLPGHRLARCGRHRQVDLAQPAARVLDDGPVHLEARSHRRVLHGRARQRAHHPADVRRLHRRRPRPRPPGHRLDHARPR